MTSGLTCIQHDKPCELVAIRGKGPDRTSIWICPEEGCSYTAYAPAEIPEAKERKAG